MAEPEEGINATEKSILLPGKHQRSPEGRLPGRYRERYRQTLQRRIIGVTALYVAAVIGIALGVTLSVTLRITRTASYSGSYTHAAVATDAAECSQIGVDVLKKNGSAVDAAIASLLCVGVLNLQSTGLGGGGFMVIYNATTDSSTVIDFRETAPGVISDEAMERYKNDAKSTIIGNGLLFSCCSVFPWEGVGEGGWRCRDFISIAACLLILDLLLA